MCMLAYCKGRKLTKTEFDNCWWMNSDGMGIAYKSGGKFHYLKGFMDHDIAWNFYKKFPNAPHVIHFRLGTSGLTSPQLTHPFICTKASELPLKHSGNETLLFHNGVVSNWREYCKLYGIDITPYMSDTRALSILISLFGKYALNKMGGYGKFIWLHDGKLYKKGNFIHKDGVYFSNDGFSYGDLWYEDYYYGGGRSYHKHYYREKSDKYKHSKNYSETSITKPSNSTKVTKENSELKKKYESDYKRSVKKYNDANFYNNYGHNVVKGSATESPTAGTTSMSEAVALNKRGSRRGTGTSTEPRRIAEVNIPPYDPKKNVNSYKFVNGKWVPIN